MRHEQKRLQEIAHQLATLSREIAAMSGQNPGTSSHEVRAIRSNSDEDFSGAVGGIKLLLKEGFFSQPRILPEVVARLRQEAYPYSSTVISNTLRRLVKGRGILARVGATAGGKERWAYQERK